MNDSIHIMCFSHNEWGFFRKFYKSLIEAMELILANQSHVLSEAEIKELTELLLVAKVLRKLIYCKDNRVFLRDWGYAAGDYVAKLNDL
jgi:hypothetical protein